LDGAIFNDRGMLALGGVTLTNNTAQGGSGGSGSGGHLRSGAGGGGLGGNGSDASDVQRGIVGGNGSPPNGGSVGYAPGDVGVEAAGYLGDAVGAAGMVLAGEDGLSAEALDGGDDAPVIGGDEDLAGLAGAAGLFVDMLDEVFAGPVEQGLARQP
jgi:hypothetical protein